MIDWYRLLPTYSTQNSPTCEKWDRLLNDLLDMEDPVMINGNRCTICGFEVWTGNWPYAYGSLGWPPAPLPRVATRKRLRKALGERKYPEVEAFVRDVMGERQG
ncbi:hypothetical protein [Novosphingobium sp. M1R2S20]|uniref:Uncharacterized protein n=1 Tax=Novosphingobium rhizovicinum TaxID=3228928 RepID=A0ABV3RDH0_9SPHN